MIVCHCQVVTDREIRDAIARGATGVCDVAVACGAGAGCGGCLPMVRDLLAERGLPTDDHLTVCDVRAHVTASALIAARSA